MERTRGIRNKRGEKHKGHKRQHKIDDSSRHTGKHRIDTNTLRSIYFRRRTLIKEGAPPRTFANLTAQTSSTTHKTSQHKPNTPNYPRRKQNAPHPSKRTHHHKNSAHPIKSALGKRPAFHVEHTTIPHAAQSQNVFSKQSTPREPTLDQTETTAFHVEQNLSKPRPNHTPLIETR